MNKILVFIGISMLLACGGGGDDDPAPTPTPTPVEKLPEKAALVFPENNEECNTGVQTNDTESIVNLSWSAATNATSYRVFVINLISGTETSNTVFGTNTDALIRMNTPYKWYVISQSNSSSVTAKSDEWKFYNSGPAVTTYAPFPAEVLQPWVGENLTGSSVDLQWQTTDVDGDLASFEVYMSAVNPPVDMIGETTDSFLNGVSVSPNTYYWQVKSIDDEGNSSQSEVFEFKISN